MNAGPSPNTISPSAGMNQNGFPGHLNNMDYQAPNFSHLNQQRQINEIEGKVRTFSFDLCANKALQVEYY